MLFLESAARTLLIVHAVAAAVLVGSSTHHLLWCRGYLSGRFGRARAERRFAWIASAAFVTTFTLGNLLYPTYKVRVRAEYLDSPAAVASEIALRDAEAAEHGHGLPARRSAPPTLASVARLFDVKEHWVALGVAASLALLVLSRRAHPSLDPRVAPLYVGLSLFVCASAWTGALVGIYVASFRAVGGGS